MTPKKIIFWIIFGIIAYSLFGYTRMHTRGDVIVYKRFAKAVMKDDSYVARSAAVGGVSREVFAVQDERKELFEDAKIVFTYYVIKERRLSDNGKTAYLRAEQVSRINPEGHDTLWGESELRIRHVVQLVLENNAWKVAEFNDPVMQP